MARIRAALRRSSPGDATPAFFSDDLKIDFEKRVVSVKNRPVRLTPKEFELLRHLVANQRKGSGAPPASAGRMGSGLRRRNRVFARVYQPTSEKNRAGSTQSPVYPYRTLGRLSI